MRRNPNFFLSSFIFPRSHTDHISVHFRYRFYFCDNSKHETRRRCETRLEMLLFLKHVDFLLFSSIFLSNWLTCYIILCNSRCVLCISVNFRSAFGAGSNRSNTILKWHKKGSLSSISIGDPAGPDTGWGLLIGSKTSQWPIGCWLVGRLIGMSVIISKKGGKFHFHTPIWALVIRLM